MLDDVSIFGESNSSRELDNMIIYHGSPNKIKPMYGKGNKQCDYGLAFYCTEDEHQADLWAVSKKGYGFTHKYSLDVKGLKILKLDEDDVLLWLAILMSNRSISDLSDTASVNLELLLDKYLTVDVNDYDVIIGYRADDSYFAFATSFLEGSLTYDYLIESIRLGKLGYQCAVKSEKAFARLKELSIKEVNSTELKTEYLNRDRIARNTFRDYSKKSAYDIARSRNKVKTIYNFIGDD